jgi:hypothetical protein
MDDLRTAIGEYTDEHLLHEYLREQSEYTPEAIAVMRKEIERRGLSPSSQESEADGGETATIRLNAQDFLPFDHSFSRTDLIIARAILQEHKIPFFEDNPSSTATLPIESESEMLYTIRVHSTFAEKAHALLDEHFLKTDNRYLLKYTGARERLKVFNFSDIHLSEKEAAVEVEVAFSREEKDSIVSLGQRLLGEADAIEQSQERVLFYYDSIEPLLDRLGESNRTMLTLSDLLTALEILQVYVDDPALPASMDEAISQLLSFFLKS